MEGKTVSYSALEIGLQMTQADANLAGNVHGGSIMKHVDNTAGLVAIRHTAGNVVTASIDRLDFHKPVFVGDILRIKASINMVGSKSMELGVSVDAENFMTGDVRHTATAYLTFVALDDKGVPCKVPELILETDNDRRRNREAIKRKEERLRQRRAE
jgi:acyl-CoA hydrolase